MNEYLRERALMYLDYASIMAICLMAGLSVAMSIAFLIKQCWQWLQSYFYGQDKDENEEA